MKKFLGVSLVAVLAVSPMMAQANVAEVGTSDTVVGVASTKYVKEAYNAMAGAVNTELGVINTAIGNKQNTIDGDHMLSADLVDDTNTKHKFVSAFEKETWSAKQAALTDGQLAAANSGITSAKVGSYDAHIASGDIHVTTADKAAWNAKVTNANQFTADSNSELIKGKTVVAAIQNTAAAVDNINNAGYITKDVNNLTNYTTTTGMNTSLAAKQDLLTNTANAGTAIAIDDATHKISVSGVKDAQIASNAAIAQSKIANLTTDLGAKVNNTGNFAGGTDSSLIKDKTVVDAIKNTAAAVDDINNAGYITKDVNNLTNYTTTTGMNTSLAAKQDLLTNTANAGTAIAIDDTTHKISVSGVTNAQIANDAAIAQSKIAGLTDALSGKQATLSTTQLAAANSGIDSTKVAKYDDYENTINSINSKVLTIYSGWNNGEIPNTTSTVTLTPAS